MVSKGDEINGNAATLRELSQAISDLTRKATAAGNSASRFSDSVDRFNADFRDYQLAVGRVVVLAGKALEQSDS